MNAEDLCYFNDLDIPNDIFWRAFAAIGIILLILSCFA